MKLLIFILFFSFSSIAYGYISSIFDDKSNTEGDTLPQSEVECNLHGGDFISDKCSYVRKDRCEKYGGQWDFTYYSYECYRGEDKIVIENAEYLLKENPPLVPGYIKNPADNNPPARGPLELFPVCKENPDGKDCIEGLSEIKIVCEQNPNREGCAAMAALAKEKGLPWENWPIHEQPQPDPNPEETPPENKCKEGETYNHQGRYCVKAKKPATPSDGDKPTDRDPAQANNKPAKNKEENQLSCNDLNFQKDCTVRSTASFKDLLVQGVTAALTFGENACASAALQALNQEQPYASTIASCQRGQSLCKTNKCDNKLCQHYENQVIKLKDDKMKLKAAYMQSVTCYNQVRAEKPAGTPIFCQIITTLNSEDCCHLAEHRNNSICQHVRNFADYNANDPKGNYDEAMEGIELTEAELPHVRFPEPNQKNEPSVNYASPSSGGGGGAIGGGAGGDPYTGGDSALPINARNSKFKPYMGAGGNKWGNKKSKANSYPMLTSVQKKIRDLRNNKNKKYSSRDIYERKIAMYKERSIFERIRDAYVKLYNKGLLTENLKKPE